MDLGELLTDAFGRVRDAVHRSVEGAGSDLLSFRADAASNTIAWLVWHLSRIEDDHIADVAGKDQVWTADGWCDRFALPFDAAATGYGQDPADVAAVRASGELLLGYHDAVHARTCDFVAAVVPGELDRIVDRRWDPPVSLGTRLVSVVADCLQHGGQAAYVRGLAARALGAPGPTGP